MEPPADRHPVSAQEIERDLHELAGLMRGIAVDGHIERSELDALTKWCDDRDAMSHTGTFADLVWRVRRALVDGELTVEERADILWHCDRFTVPNAYFSVASRDLQKLQGLLAGIGADRVVKPEEIEELRAWMASVAHLRGSWPYDEIDALVASVLEDGRIDEEEHTFLLVFCRQFLASTKHLVLETPFDDWFVRHGVCASKPDVRFQGRSFCVTGALDAAHQAALERTIVGLGGATVAHVRPDLDYLVVAAPPDAAWAFSCHGRRVEEAMALRKAGQRLVIVHESDLRAAAGAQGWTG